MRCWVSHYESLGTDITGHGQVEDYLPHICPDPLGPKLEELNASFTKMEMWQALGMMKCHEASGKDGVPRDLLQVCLQEKPLVARYPYVRGPSWLSSVLAKPMKATKIGSISLRLIKHDQIFLFFTSEKHIPELYCMLFSLMVALDRLKIEIEG